MPPAEHGRDEIAKLEPGIVGRGDFSDRAAL